MMKITIEFVPNEEVKARKGFGGADWFFDHYGDYDAFSRRVRPQSLTIRVANELPREEQMALAIHELVEAVLCEQFGIKTEDVDKFDLQHLDDEKNPAFNSGDHHASPYYAPHQFATSVERMIAALMNVDWNAYDERLSAL